MCRYARSIGELEKILVTTAAFCREHGATSAEVFACELTVEELFTNFVRHNRGGGDHIRFELAMSGGALTMTLTDYDVEPFDPAGIPAVDVTAPADQRRPGGLGLFLVKAYMDAVRFEYTDRALCVTATKRLEAGDVRHPTE